MVTPASQNRRLLDRYDLRQSLGKGGMGTVWLADDTLLQRQVAIKEVAFPAGVPANEVDALRERVMREARAAGRLNHPNVTTIYDVVREDGRTWIVMEYVDAPTLTELVTQNGPLSVEDAAALGLQVLGALEAAHREGIVHRDVKPSNVMVSPAGEVKLADFGVAAVQGDPKLTMTGFVIGSPSYMSPEQAREGRSTAASDLWGLGATLYFAVEGQPPFDRGAPIPTLTAVTHDDPAPIHRAGLLEPVVLGLLHKDPAARPAAGELAAALREAAGATTSGERAVAPTAVLADTDAAAPQTYREIRLDDDTPTSGWERTGPQDDVAARREAGSRIWPLLLAALGLLIVAGITLPRLLGDGGTPTQAGERDDRAAQAQEEPAEDTAAGDQQAGGDADAEQAEEPAPDEPAAEDGDAGADDDAENDAEPAPAGGEVTVPEGWTQYEVADTGSSVAYPQDWEVIQRSANASDLTDPEGNRYLRVEYTDSPKDDAVADWEAQSDAFASRKSDYEEIRIEPVDFRGHEAALWEYTYSEGGADLHAYNLAVVAGGRGYALNFQTHESVWEDSQPLWEQFTASFDPAE